ncbi:response regulator [Dongia sp.]|jgi:CheY-like chemotaxis protein|uniref:response regulator n=1 Tax=Dongia sp. TaxID=1977262 RepID=UPI0035AEA64C
MNMNTAPISIVMIEDDDGHARLIEKNIRRAGITNEIIPFTLGKDALSYIEREGRLGREGGDRKILVLLDLNLPDMSGLDILAKVKGDERTKRIPIIVLTTTDDKVEIQKCYDLGCSAYVKKPLEYEAFANSVRQLGLFFAIIELPPA